MNGTKTFAGILIFRDFFFFFFFKSYYVTFWFQAMNVQNSLDDFQYEHARTHIVQISGKASTQFSYVKYRNK